MTIEQTNLIDIISTDERAGEVILTISDHLDWSETTVHLHLLQEKLNRYLAFVESGEIMEKYPNARDRAVVFRVVSKFTPNPLGLAFLAKAADIIQSAGFSWCQEVVPGSSDT
jgi:hypothetical protein